MYDLGCANNGTCRIAVGLKIWISSVLFRIDRVRFLTPKEVPNWITSLNIITTNWQINFVFATELYLKSPQKRAILQIKWLFIHKDEKLAFNRGKKSNFRYLDSMELLFYVTSKQNRFYGESLYILNYNSAVKYTC